MASTRPRPKAVRLDRVFCLEEAVWDDAKGLAHQTSVQLDLAWLGYIAWYPRLGDAVRYFVERYGSVIDYLRWTSVRAK